MKPLVAFLAVAAVLASTAAVGALRLKPIMHDWKAKVASVEPMVMGGAPYDEAEVRRTLAALIGDTRDIEAGITGKSAQAAEIKSRFSQFEADASATLQALNAQDHAKTHFQRMRGDCRSCHDAFAN
jgi:cytochrome c556